MTPSLGRTELLDVGGRSLNLWRAGDSGPVVLLIHGIPTNHRLWWDVVPALQGQARVLAVDLLGYGWSDSPDGWGVDLASQASYLVTVLDRLSVDRATVVGHDLGGGVAQILAVTQPDRVAGLGIVNGVCYDAWPVPLVRALKATWPVIHHAPRRALPAVLGPPLRTLFAHGDRAAPYVERFVEPWRQAADGPQRLAAHLRALDSVYTQTVAPFLPRLAVPTEVVWGRQDHQLKPHLGRRLAADIPGAALTWVDDASHFVPADRPDVVTEAVLRLLDRTGT